MREVIKITGLIFAGALIGSIILKEGYKPTPVELELKKEVVVEKVPEVKYISGSKYVILTTKERSEIVDKDTLVKPSDYKYNINDTYFKDGVTIKFDANGWGDIHNMKFDIISVDKVSVNPKRIRNNSLFVSGIYTPPNKYGNSGYGIGLDYIIKDAVIVGSSATMIDGVINTDVKIGFKL